MTNPVKMEFTKRTIKAVMEDLLGRYKADPKKFEDDIVIDEVFKAHVDGSDFSRDNVVRCRKLIAAGFQPKEMSQAELMKENKKLPRLTLHILHPELAPKNGKQMIIRSKALVVRSKKKAIVKHKATKKPFSMHRMAENVAKGEGRKNRAHRNHLKSRSPDVSPSPKMVGSLFKEFLTKTCIEARKYLVDGFTVTGIMSGKPMVHGQQARTFDIPFNLPPLKPGPTFQLSC